VEVCVKNRSNANEKPGGFSLKTVRAFLQLSWYVENLTQKSEHVNSFLKYYMRKHCLIARRIGASRRKPFIFKHLL